MILLLLWVRHYLLLLIAVDGGCFFCLHTYRVCSNYVTFLIFLYWPILLFCCFSGNVQTVVIHKQPVEEKSNKKNLEKAEKEKQEKIKEKEQKENKNTKNNNNENNDNNNGTTVILENLVSLEDASDPSLKGEIASEAEKYGSLKNIEIVIDQKKKVKIFLTYFLCDDAVKSYNAMNGRFFGGRTVTAILLPSQ